MIARHEFLEWAEVHGNFYGTSQKWIADQLAAGHDVLLEIDWQGAQQVRKLFPQAIGIFILPPSMEELTRRLTGRGTDSADVIARRLAAAQAEMRHVGEFDYVIINDQLAQALEELRAVVRASRLSFGVQRVRHAALFERLI
jgi:guanylate kinase